MYRKKTKEINKIQEENKTYLATIKVGESTPSYDRETEIDNIYPTSHINEELIMDSIKSLEVNLNRPTSLFCIKD